MTFIKKEHAKNLILQESQKHIGFEWLYKSVYDRVSKCAEVEAIPIEWIKKWCNKEHNRKSLEERLLKRYGVLTLLEDWEKENETH